MVLCACGCGEETKEGNRFIHGHNFKGVKRSEENCKNISKGLMGKKLSPEHRQKMIIIMGSPEMRERISKTEMGKIVSEDTKEKLRISHLGKKQSDETKSKRSEKMKGKNNHMYGIPPSHKSSSGKRCYYDSPLQGKIWLRSSYELAYARYLDENKILWYYEIETFDLGDTTYTPDFFLPQFEKFIEIKGYMYKHSQKRIDKFLEQYSWNLEILYGKDLIKLGIEL